MSKILKNIYIDNKKYDIPDISGDVLTKDNTTSFVPTGDYNPATKKYVDDSVVEYNAGEGIEIGDYTNYSALRGPCQDGFHIPLITEWSGLKTIMGGLSLNTGNNWRINLHMPFAGAISDYDASHYQQGTYGFYWSATPYSLDNTFAYNMFIRGDTNTAPDDSSSNRRAYGNTIRPFKDIYEIPTSTWTVVQGTLGSAGIFWNQTEGLISITDGTTGYTIMDKNLGATTVYSDGDTLTDENCGYMYQWGNNYGFPSVSTISDISSIQIDASNYGPGNYYSSSTFIKRTGNPHDWSSVRNNNLRGGETGVVTIDNAITNTGVLSVNGQTGNVTIDTSEASSITTTQPSNPVEGDVYYDTTNDVLKVYDGTNWNETGKEYNAGKGIEIEDGPDHSAMQGPASSGYHVPSKDEWDALRGILITTFSMAANATTVGTYLKMPMTGRRAYNNASIYGVGSYGYYWTSTPLSTNNAQCFYFDSSDIAYQNYDFRAQGYSVRCFKDIPTIPTSSWTTLYDGSSIATGAGIFYNATDGLISVSGDGQTWYTIQDKNLGATTVFNQGDTVSDANSGYFYQWGNNYGFSHSGNVTTSSTKVDASNYGPGNYYSSSTYIAGSSDWSSVQNDNLWGGVTGVVTLDNAITNTGVLSVNGQTGNVGGAIVSSDTPSNAIIGTLWYDTTNSVLKIYNGSSWISI